MSQPPAEPLAPGKGAAVQGMFASIARRYDRLNHLLSMGQDRRWRAAMMEQLPELEPGVRVLDLCTGTGDVAFELAGAVPRGATVHASDFCEPMVALAPAKAPDEITPPCFHVADAMALPFGAAHFKAITIAFGLRNVEDPSVALAEMARVLTPGGRLLILEFGRPQNRMFSAVYRLYVFHILPWIGRLVSGSKEAYRYLPESVWAWYGTDVLAGMMRQAGFDSVTSRPFYNGAVVLHMATRATA